MGETLQERIKRLSFCRDCIDKTYEAGRMEYERLDTIIKELKRKGNVQNKKEQIKNVVGQALDIYKHHRKFTLSVSDKTFSDFTVLVYPSSQKMPGGYLPAAFHSGLLFRGAWRENPEAVLDWCEKYL